MQERVFETEHAVKVEALQALLLDVRVLILLDVSSCRIDVQLYEN